MQREVIRPDYDQPIVVKLDTAPEAGIQKEGKFGIDFQYYCNDDAGIMWLPAIGRDALLQSGAGPGDTVQITKTRRGKTTLFSALVLEMSVSAARADRQYQQQPQQQPQAHHQQTHARRAPIPRAAYYQPETGSVPAAHTAPAPAGPQIHPLEELMQRCIVVGGRAVWAAYQELTAAGIQYDMPTIEDARVAGISLFIERNRNNGGAR